MAGTAQYNLTASDGTTAQAAIGQIVEIKGARWAYAKASSTVTQYQLCQLDDSGFCAPCTTTTATSTIGAGSALPAGVGPAQFAVPSGEYFWLPVGPFFLREDDVTKFYVLGAASCVLDVLLYTTGTAGVVDDTSAANTILVRGLRGTTTLTGAAAMPCIASIPLILG